MVMNKIKSKAQLITLGILVGVILILANTLLSHHFVRWDVTEDKEYTLSDSTKKVLKSLDDKVTIRLFFTKKVPPNIAAAQEQIADIIEEYRTYSKSRINVEWVVPEESPQKEQEAQMMGIPPLQLNVIEADKQEVRKVYLGIAILYADKKQILPLVANLNDLEYNLTSAILKLTSRKSPKLGLILPEGQQAQGMGYENLGNALGEEFQIKKLSINDKDFAKENFSAVMLVQPKQVSPELLTQLDQLFDAGVPLMILGGTIEVGANMAGSTYTTGIDDWLEKKGLTLVPGLLFDPQNAGKASFSSGMVRYLLPYPYFVRIEKEGLNKENPATHQLEVVTLPWSNTVETKAEDHPDWKYTPLLTSSSSSFIPGGELRVDPQSIQEMEYKAGEKHTVGVIVDVPDAQKPKKIIFIPNNNFVRDNFSGDNPENVLFVQNLVDWASWGSDLIGIRSRGKSTRPLLTLPSSAISALRWAHLIVIPLAFIGLGLMANVMRKRRYKNITESLS